MSGQNKSWLLRNPKMLGFLSKYRNFVLRRSYFLGDKVAQKLINLGYLIKTSQFYRNALVDTDPERRAFYERIIREHQLSDQEIIYLEFGVYKGESFKFWLENNHHPNSFFTGFDTFSGLPEDWGHIPKGHFDTHGNIPIFNDERHNFSKGLFSVTLPNFLLSNSSSLSKRLVINLDADLYSSTLFVLAEVSKYLKSGDIIIFDEFFSIVNASTEFRAFLDHVSAYSLRYKIIAKSNIQCAFKVL